MNERINDGKYPVIGLGTYKMTPSQLEIILPTAITLGYRLIDTAQVYRNEQAIGDILSKLIAQGKCNRTDLFIQTKIGPANQGYQKCLASIKQSIADLQVDYLDCCLIHWPGAAGLDPSDPANAKLRAESLEALRECQQQGLVRNIGVSNYCLEHLKAIEAQVDGKLGDLILVNQFELHPFWPEEPLVAYCKEQGITVQAYSSLGKGIFTDEVWCQQNAPVLLECSKRHGKSIAQLLLRWAYQKGFALIPKTASLERLRENVDLYMTCLSVRPECPQKTRIQHQQSNHKECCTKRSI